MCHEVRHAHCARDKLGQLFGGPGWQPGDSDRGLISTQARAAHDGPRVAAWDRPDETPGAGNGDAAQQAHSTAHAAR